MTEETQGRHAGPEETAPAPEAIANPVPEAAFKQAQALMDAAGDDPDRQVAALKHAAAVAVAAGISVPDVAAESAAELATDAAAPAAGEDTGGGV